MLIRTGISKGKRSCTYTLMSINHSEIDGVHQQYNMYRGLPVMGNKNLLDFSMLNPFVPQGVQ